MENVDNNFDKTEFKVKFLGQYHDMVIIWDDHRWGHMYSAQQQVFKQLASITGIPIRCYRRIYLFEARRIPPNRMCDGSIYRHYIHFDNSISFPCSYEDFGEQFNQRTIHNACIRDGERFHLSFNLAYDSYPMRRLGIECRLVPEYQVTEGACSVNFCQHTNTESFFFKIKDIVTNDELVAQISRRVQPVMGSFYWYREADVIFKEFNIKQYLSIECEISRIAFPDIPQEALYLRKRA